MGPQSTLAPCPGNLAHPLKSGIDWMNCSSLGWQTLTSRKSQPSHEMSRTFAFSLFLSCSSIGYRLLMDWRKRWNDKSPHVVSKVRKKWFSWLLRSHARFLKSFFHPFLGQQLDGWLVGELLVGWVINSSRAGWATGQWLLVALGG